MKTKKTAALVLALLLVLALFAGCNGSNGGTTPTQAPATQAPATQAPAGQATEAPAEEDEGPYHYARNYATDEDGWPLEKYVYERPIADDDTTFTRWTTCYTPQYLPEDGFNSIETWQKVAEWTGVHIEYDVVDSANRQQNLAVLLASDDLDDIIDQGWYLYSGTLDQALDEGYFADLYEYRHLMPNFMWEIHERAKTNPDVMNTMFYKKSHLVTLYGLVMDPVPSMGYVLRGDWMDTLGLGSSLDVETFDDMHEILTAFKVNMSNNQYNKSEIFPFFIYSVGESTPGFGFSGYNTVLYMSKLNYMRVVDGQVQFLGAQDDDKALMTMLNQWYSEGLISPNFQSYVIGSDFDDGHRADQVGAMPQTPGAVSQDEHSSLDPNTRWEPVHRTKLYSGQTLQYGNKLGETHYGSANLSAKCDNLELLCSYMDWWMSDFGGEWTSWGPEGSGIDAGEGYCWFYNEKGEKQLTNWVMTHDAGAMWIMIIYANNNLVEFCLHDISRSYFYPGGEREWNFYDVWKVKDYGGQYDWPSGVTFTDEETDEANTIKADLETYFSENYVSFLNGVKPLSEWDSYIQDMKTFGLDRLTEIYQNAYDAFISEQ